MSELKSYVDNLFKKYEKSNQVNELREEILINLEAKKEDLIKQGVDEKIAIEQSKKSIISVDNLIEGNKLVAIDKLKIECLQWSLIYLIVTWIITIPIGIFNTGFVISFLLIASIVIIGITYIMTLKRGRILHISKNRYVNYFVLKKVKNLIWILWLLFIVLSILTTTAVYFGSNMWFSRPIKIDGPYAFGLILIRYLMPFLTVIIPLFYNKFFILINKYEVGEKNED